MSSAQRLFVALPVTPAFAASFMRLPRKGLEARWAHPDDLHLTLRFLGDVDTDRIEDVALALSRIRRPAFHLDINGLDVFEEKKGPAILYARIESVRKVMDLCALVMEELTPLGFEFPHRPFIPHITLARVDGGDLDRYVRSNARAVRDHSLVSGFNLMRSATPDEKGSHYSILETFPLATGR